MNHTDQIKSLLDAYFESGDATVLDQACAATSNSATDIAELLRWLKDDAIAEPEPLDLATRRVRRALKLPMMPGPVCRPFKP